MKYLILIFTLLFNTFAYACSCITPSIEEAFKHSDYVYLGQIESAKLTGNDEVTNYLTVLKEFKGSRTTDILMSKIGGGSCASPAAVGFRYIVFGHRETTPELQTCGNTRVVFHKEQEILDKLNRLASN